MNLCQILFVSLCARAWPWGNLMLSVHAAALTAIRLVLASSSPRRVELIRDNLGLNVEVCPSNFAEDLRKSDFADAKAYCQETARRKAEEVAARCCGAAAGRAELVIAADTVVSLAGSVLEKPRDTAHACEMLRALSGSDHEVITAVSLIYLPADRALPRRERTVAEITRVRFASLTEGAIQAYVDSGEPMDKAGAYGIQGRAGAFVTRIEGCYFNVVGLPLNRLCVELTSLLELEEP
jgi:septum formation protein